MSEATWRMKLRLDLERLVLRSSSAERQSPMTGWSEAMQVTVGSG